MKGWFDAFRSDGGPTLYSFSNRTAVTGDVAVIAWLAVFATLYVAFLIVFPGIRRERFTTFWSVTLSLFVGATISISLCGSAWHVASAPIRGTYRAFSKEKVSATLGAYVGLDHVNITLRGNATHDIDFNERFSWIDSRQMGDSFREALVRGLPYPVLTVAEHFATGQDGLAWGGQYRAAGYFAAVALRTSFAAWLLMNLMLVVVPRYGALLMTACGFLLLATACGYFGMLPDAPLLVRVDGAALRFSFGWCYWLVLAAGAVCLLVGVVTTTLEIVKPHSFLTILEVNYDTPYDRHVIIEDSRGRKDQRKRTTTLEEPHALGLGSRILRRLSSKQRDEKAAAPSNFELAGGPWKYPDSAPRPILRYGDGVQAPMW
ncbi:dual oxidase maturation factor 2 [Cylas formicarius]|uniref:dual oxidase maturation factor 2 n=1 Tax=Cylas formicarius TaxID=197179 RepID=UPI0029584D36|nr:dual oxidase maturation factor 2 [Cylas formicarius]